MAWPMMMMMAVHMSMECSPVQYGTHTQSAHGTLGTYSGCWMPIWWCIFIAQCGLWLRFTVFTMPNVDGDINIYVVYCSFNFICCRCDVIHTRMCLSPRLCCLRMHVYRWNFLRLIYAISWHLIFVLLYICALCSPLHHPCSSRCPRTSNVSTQTLHDER